MPLIHDSLLRLRFRASWVVTMLGACLFFHAMPDALAKAEFQSGPGQKPLVELFSSEGCSSCPPADRWFSQLQKDPGLWKKFVPVVFHVTYWDYLGWRDRLARPEFTQRQRDYAALWHAPSVYTPGVVLNGREWRGWHRARRPETAEESQPGVLIVVSPDGRSFDIRFYPGADAGEGSFRVFGAALGFDVRNEVTAGENRGSRLEHDFVVLGWQEIELQRTPQGSHEGRLMLTPDPSIPARRYGAAFWILRGKSMVPLQAAGGYLP